jgi:hypothetical protein
VHLIAGDGSLLEGLLGAVAGIATPIVGLIGVIVGAAVAGILARSNDTRKVVTDIRREVYFEAMDLAVSMYEQLTVLSRNGPRGGADPEADKMAGEAIDALMQLMPRFVRSEARVATVGSATVSEATYDFRRATDDYMKAVFEQHGAGKMFRVGVAALHLGRYASTLERLARSIRSDLGLAPLNTSLPVTREALDRAARLPPARWCPDPTGRYQWRWWNGAYWDETVVRDGTQTTDDEPVRTEL